MLAPRTGRARVYAGDADKSDTVFDLSVGRSRDAPSAFLKGWGPAAVHHFIKVLRLLEGCDLDDLTAAVERTVMTGATTADVVRVLLEQRRKVPVALAPSRVLPDRHRCTPS
jgi:hypothetical protein